jgi:hypothetical protein
VLTRFQLVFHQIVHNFVEMAKGRSQFYRHNKLLIPFGDDFAHREAYVSLCGSLQAVACA